MFPHCGVRVALGLSCVETLPNMELMDFRGETICMNILIAQSNNLGVISNHTALVAVYMSVYMSQYQCLFCLFEDEVFHFFNVLSSYT